MADFSEDEIALLREHGFVLWSDRLIFDAQPPMTEVAIAAVEAHCAGAIPQPLRELWRTTAGGSLGYDLSLDMNGQPEAISWTELFYNDSDGYRDLEGWIEHELELAEEAAEENDTAFDGKLEWLPIGGFEYLNRIYVCVRPDDEYGRVLAWKQGLPPAWTHRLHEDAISTIADDLPAAFKALRLDDDPQAPADEYPSSSECMEAIETRVEDHGLDRALADRLIAFYRRAHLDWRALLAEGRLEQYPQQARLAIAACARADDAQTLQLIRAAGIELRGKVSGGATAVDLAIVSNAWNVLDLLLASKIAVPKNALLQINGAIPPSLLADLIAHGAKPLPEAVALCAIHDAHESAKILIERMAVELGAVIASEQARGAMTALRLELRRDLTRVESGMLHHYLGADGLRSQIAAIDDFIAAIDAT
jgi:hypothetical protein